MALRASKKKALEKGEYLQGSNASPIDGGAPLREEKREVTNHLRGKTSHMCHKFKSSEFLVIESTIAYNSICPVQISLTFPP
jgi:hypothetical protein